MRIQHNISAMNSYRQLGNNNNMLSKNLEKLSSGFRINRAGDDAAGLAISEKMRSQIKGLETAQKNANDGISLVQTAEGALTEVHSMLNRMTELATQSANGTYDNEVDRANLQKEVSALLEEIDRISESTNFNGINLLDGSLGMNTEAFSDITSTAEVHAGTSNSAISFTDDGVVASKKGNATAKKASFNIDLAALGTTKAGANGNLTVKIGDANPITVAVTKTGDDIATAVKKELAKFDGTDASKTLTIDGIGYKTADGVTFTMVQDPDDNETVAPNYNVSISGAADGVMAGEYIDATTTNTVGQGKTATKLAEAEFKLNLADIKEGTKLTIAGEEYTFKLDKDSTLSGAGVIDLEALGITADNIKDKGAEVAAAVALAAKDNATFTVGADGDKLQLLETTTHQGLAANNAAKKDLSTVDAVKAQVSMSTTVTDAVATTSVNVDASKMVAGDKLTIDGTTYEFVAVGGKASDGNTAIEVAGLSGTAGTATGDAAAALVAKLGASATADGNKVTISAAKMGDAAPKVGSSGVKLQVGDTAEDFNKVNVKIDSTDATTLGIADINISTQEGAAAAIEKIKTAINTVSSTRGDLGAVQNRLEHTINNLGVTTENITAAESRIRDTDMASEMMAYTKNNILIQASQAMLAQANQVPQGVLQLLQ